MSKPLTAESRPPQQEIQKPISIVKKENIRDQAKKTWEIENINRTIDGIKNELEEIADEIQQGYRLINKNKPDTEENRVLLTPKMRNEMVEDSDELRQELKIWQEKEVEEQMVAETTKALQDQIPAPPKLPITTLSRPRVERRVYDVKIPTRQELLDKDNTERAMEELLDQDQEIRDEEATVEKLSNDLKEMAIAEEEKNKVKNAPILQSVLSQTTNRPESTKPVQTESQPAPVAPPKKSWLPASVRVWGKRTLIAALGLVGVKLAAEPVTDLAKDFKTAATNEAESFPAVQAARRQEKIEAGMAALQAQSAKEKAETLVAGGAVEVGGKTVVIPAETKSRTRTPATERATSTFNLQGEKAPDATVAPWWNLPEQGTPQPMSIMPDSAPEGASSMWGESLTPEETKAQVSLNTEILTSFFIKNPARPITRTQAEKAYTNLVQLLGKSKAQERLASISEMTNRPDQRAMTQAIETFRTEMGS